MPFVRQQLESSARTTNGTFKVNQTAIENVQLPIPSMKTQERFGHVANVIARLRERYESTYGNDLFSSLVHRAFRGELTPQNTTAKKQLAMFDDVGGQ